MRQLIANRIQTPDGTILWSRFTHDFAYHVDKVTGEKYMIDGGQEYVHRTINQVPAKDLCVYDDAPWEEQRKVILRGTMVNTGQVEPRIYWIPLYKLTDEHLNGILKYNKERNMNDSRFSKWVRKEIRYRKQHNIVIPERTYTLDDAIDNKTLNLN